MRKRDISGCWQQLLTILGTSLLPKEEWIKIHSNFSISWERIYYINLDENDLPAADVNPIIENHDGTAPPADVVSAPGEHTYSMAPPSGPAVGLIKRRNSLTPPPGPSVCRIKRRSPVVPPSAASIKRRHSLVPPSAPSIHPIKRRNSLVPPLAPPIHPTKTLNPKGQICGDTLLETAKRTNSVAAADSLSSNQTDMVLSPIKRRDSVIPKCELMYDELNSPIKRRDSLTLDQWVTPIQLISPLAPSPISRRDSLSSDLGMNRKQSVSPLGPTDKKRRNSSVPAPPRSKSKSSQRKPLQKPMNVVKHVTGSGDELDDEMSLLAWKEYGAQRKAIETKPLQSPQNGFPPQKCPNHVQEEPKVKRKRGRPSREEKAKRLEEEQALKMQQGPLKRSSSDLAKQDPDPESCKNAEETIHQDRAPQTLDVRKQQQKTASLSTTISISPEPTKSHKHSEPPKKKPTAKPRCQPTSSLSDQKGLDIATHSNQLIIDEDAVPSAHMPADALDLKSPPKNPPGDKEENRADAEREGKVDDEVRPKSNSTANGYNSKNGRSMYNGLLGRLSSDDAVDEQLLLQQTGFILNDYEAEEHLLDDAMDLTSPVGGVDDDKDALIIDIDFDQLVKDDNVANQIALIDSQPEISFHQYQEAIDNSENNDQCLEKSASANDHQLPHASEFFEKLSSRPPVDVNADKSNMLWPFMDEDEVLDYEVDYDVLTLVVSSDELEDECLGNTKKESKKTESESRTQINVQVKPPKPEVPSKPIDKTDISNANGLRGFRIPRLNPEVLKAQPSVMHSLYLQEDTEQKMEKVKPADPPHSEEVRKRREEAIAARRPKETTPQFAPPYRPTREESVSEMLSQPMFGPQNLASPLFGPDDLAPVSLPPGNREESNYPHPRDASQYPPVPFLPNCSSLIPRNFIPEVPPQQHPTGVSQYVPQNLATGQRNTRPAEVSLPRYQGLGGKHWMMEIFGVKCLRYLDNKCMAPNCDHTMSPVGEVERRLLSMPEETLIQTYRQALRSFYIFEKYFKCFANIFERRKLYKHLLQMMANGRLYRNMAVPIVKHIFLALKRSGMEREATGCMMTDLWRPDKAHKFRELTVTILKILEATNWQDYIDQLVELHEKYKFLLSEEFMIRIIQWADQTKNEALQKKAMVMLLRDLATYAQSPTLMALVDRFSNPDPSSNFPRSSPEQQQQQFTASNWNPNTESNQVPSLIPQQDRLPGAGSIPPLIRKSPPSRQPAQYPAAIWNHDLNTIPNLVPQQERLSGAGPGAAFIRCNSVLKPHWNHNPNPNTFCDPTGAGPGPSLIRSSQEQQQSASTWRSKADNLTRADENTIRSFPAGFQ